MKRDARHYAFIKLSRGAAPKLLVVRGAGSEDGGSTTVRSWAHSELATPCVN